MKDMTPGWFDVIALIVLILGFVIGRKRGMSNELLDVLQWLMMVVLGAQFYKPLAGLLVQYAKISLFWAQVDAYLVIILAIKIGFTALKRMVGEKLVSGDMFGRLEYHLGMLAGLLRHSCILVVVLSLLHARDFSVTEVQEDLKAQEKLYGSAFFPTFGKTQVHIFHSSIVGQLARTHLSDHLIRPEFYESKVERAKLIEEREKAVEETMNPKKKKKTN